jgi:hypothetical protein
MSKKILLTVCTFLIFALTACNEPEKAKLDNCIESSQCKNVVIDNISEDNSELSIGLRSLELSEEATLAYTFNKVNEDSGKLAFIYTVDETLSQIKIESSKVLYLDILSVLEKLSMSYNMELKVVFSNSEVELLCTEELCSINVYFALESSDLFVDIISNKADEIIDVASMENQITHVYFTKNSSEVTLYFELSTSKVVINYKDVLNEIELTTLITQVFPNHEVVD